MAKKTYSVQSRVEHNGEPFEVGAAIELDDKHALPLLAVGAIAEPPRPAEPVTAADKKAK